MQGGASFNPNEKSGTVIFQMSKQDATHEITNPDFDEDGHPWATKARLIRPGDFLFLDLGSSGLEDSKNATVPYPAIRGQLFGRTYLEKDKMRSDFLLSNKWISDRAKEAKLALATVGTRDGTGLSAKAQELQKFAVEHAGSQGAFLESFVLQRKK